MANKTSKAAKGKKSIKRASEGTTRGQQLDMTRRVAGKQVVHLSTPEIERRIKVVQADLIQTETRVEELTSQLADERSRRAMLQASIDGMIEVVVSR